MTLDILRNYTAHQRYKFINLQEIEKEESSKCQKKYGIIDLISYAPMMVDEVIGKNLKATNMHE